MIATAVIGAGTAVYGISEGAKKKNEGMRMQREAQQKIDKFQWEEFTNPFRTQQVSTLGADLQVEQNNISEASMVDALRGGGNRAITGGLGRVQENTNLVNAKIAADLDKQRKDIDMAAAGDDVRIRAMKYDRQTNELAGLGQMMNIGMNTRNSGSADIINGIGALGQVTGAYGSQVKGLLPSSTNVPTSGASNNVIGNAIPSNILSGGVNYEAARQWSNMINLNQNTPDYNKLYGFGGGLSSLGNN